MKIVEGARCGKLVVLRLIKHPKNPTAECQCDCGKVVTRQRGGLSSGRATSCGCEKAKAARLQKTVHGKAGTAIYHIWQAMLARCYRKSSKAFKNYGARGIKVEWATFEDFYADMGDCPEGLTLERRDTNGNYGPGNCVWADWTAQAENKRTSKRWSVDGVEYSSSAAAAAVLGVDASTINRRTNGRIVDGKTYAPAPGYENRLAYDDKS